MYLMTTKHSELYGTTTLNEAADVCTHEGREAFISVKTFYSKLTFVKCFVSQNQTGNIQLIIQVHMLH